MFVCKICGSNVRAGQAFCNKCGADVVETHQTICPSCKTKNDAGSLFCANCGYKLGMLKKPVCVVCKSKNLPGAKYCVDCGAPVIAKRDTHTTEDYVQMLDLKRNLDKMQADRIGAIEREIAQKKVDIQIEKDKSFREISDYKSDVEKEVAYQAQMLEEYRNKINEIGSDDINLMKKLSVALKNYSVYYADPYSQIDEDEIESECYICPSCGTINPLNVTTCTHCGRNKARSTLLLAKGKITQSPPIKREKIIIPSPKQDLEVEKTPDFNDFVDSHNVVPKKEEKEIAKEDVEPNNFATSTHSMGYPYQYPPTGYAYPPSGYPHQPAYPYLINEKTGEPYQMPPIVQPVAFVPYVTQDQELIQYTETEPVRPIAQAIPIKNEESPSHHRKGRKS